MMGTNEEDRQRSAIVCEDVIRIFHTGSVRYRALRGVSFTVEDGEKVAITGPSGSGKSTLLQLLAGLDYPTSGQVRVFGQEISDMPEESLVQFRKDYTAFVFQDFGLLDMSALDNVAFPLMLRGVPRDVREDQAADLLRDLGLSAHLDHFPSELSGGQRQRVAIARALIPEPRLLFCDEPTGNLDSSNAVRIMELLAEEAERRHATLVVVTHDTEHLDWATQTLRIQDGMVADSQDARS